MDNTAKIVISILGVLLILSNGAQFVLRETGSNKACSTGWTFQQTGVQEGKYACFATATPRYETCARVWDSTTGKINYWCAQAILEPIQPVEVPNEPPGEAGAIVYHCHAPAERGCEIVQ